MGRTSGRPFCVSALIGPMIRTNTGAVMRRLVLSLAASAAFLLPTHAAEFQWATQTDPQTMDPHAVNAAPVLSFLNNVYEGLVRRDETMAIVPALATSWEAIPEEEGGPGWRFNLREGVTFHNGESFEAADVLFSYERASSEEADTASWFAPVTRVEAPDAMTVEIFTQEPNPIFPDSIANWMMMDEGWTVGVGAALPNKDGESATTRQANGTGPYRLGSRDPGISTTLVPFENWWDENPSNITTATLTPIANPATRIAALLAGEVDLIDPVPIQDAARLEETEGVRLIDGIEARVIMLGFDQTSDDLFSGDESVEGNPLRNRDVREAIYRAIDTDALIQVVMRGSAQEVAQLVGPGLRGYSEALEPRFEADIEAAQSLLEQAGYPDGFALSLACPNDRYINDESICQAVVGMLARIGVTAELNAMPVRQYWPELREDNYDMFLLGWSPGTFDAEHPIRFLAATPNDEARLGSWNYGGFSNARVDELLPQIQSEIDEPTRQAMLDEVATIIRDEAAYVPLYVQPLLWGARDGVEVVQRPDNFFILRWATVAE